MDSRKRDIDRVLTMIEQSRFHAQVHNRPPPAPSGPMPPPPPPPPPRRALDYGAYEQAPPRRDSAMFTSTTTPGEPLNMGQMLHMRHEQGHGRATHPHLGAPSPLNQAAPWQAGVEPAFGDAPPAGEEKEEEESVDDFFNAIINEDELAPPVGGLTPFTIPHLDGSNNDDQGTQFVLDRTRARGYHANPPAAQVPLPEDAPRRNPVDALFQDQYLPFTPLARARGPQYCDSIDTTIPLHVRALDPEEASMVRTYQEIRRASMAPQHPDELKPPSQL